MNVGQGPMETAEDRMRRMPAVLIAYARDIERYGKPLDSGLPGVLLFLAKQLGPQWKPIPPRSCVSPTHEAADAFWKYWKENGETHKHGYYESTWGAINAALNATHNEQGQRQDAAGGLSD